MKKIYNKRESRSRRKTDYRRLLFPTQVCHLLKWLIKTYGICPHVYEPACRYMWFIQHMYLHKGLKTAIQRIKEDRLSVLQYLSGETLTGNGLTYDGLPKKLYGLIPYIRRRDLLELRFVMTLLYSLRRIHLPVQPKLETVTSPSTAGYYEWMFKYFPGFLKAVCKRLPRHQKFNKNLKFPSWEGYHLTTKGSPSGGQALVSSLQDLVFLPESLLTSIKTFSGSLLYDKMVLLRHHALEISEIMNQPIGSRKTIRRLSYFPDSEGKTRLIALGDYFSQTCLKPLHSYLNTVLRSIPQDQTFNQGKGLKELAFNSKVTYYSFDLSAFTDRFPIKILLGLLFSAYGRDKALAWYDIINGYDFEYKDPTGLLNNIRYNVGNPMGFYTSWPLTTLCHHFIVYVSCQEIGISWNRAKYKLLGDDIIIFDDELALKYQELISLIGVDIQLQKSHIGNSLFEFAKRNFIQEGEISPFSIKAGLSETGSYIGFIELLDHQRLKGWNPVIPILTAVLNFYQTSPSRYRFKDRGRQENKIRFSSSMHKRLRGYDTDLDLVREIQVLDDYPQLSCNMSKKAKAIFENCIVQCFEESASKFVGDLELRLERALLYYTDDTVEERNVDVVYAHPYSFVYGKYIEELYLSQMKRAYDFDTIEKGEWLPYFRILKASDSNILFCKRNYIRDVSSSPLLIKKLRQVLYELKESPYLS